MRLGVRWKMGEGLDRGGMSGDEDGWHSEGVSEEESEGGGSWSLTEIMISPLLQKLLSNHFILGLSQIEATLFRLLAQSHAADTQSHCFSTKEQKSESLFTRTMILLGVSDDKHASTSARDNALRRRCTNVTMHSHFHISDSYFFFKTTITSYTMKDSLYLKGTVQFFLSRVVWSVCKWITESALLHDLTTSKKAWPKNERWCKLILILEMLQCSTPPQKNLLVFSWCFSPHKLQMRQKHTQAKRLA